MSKNATQTQREPPSGVVVDGFGSPQEATREPPPPTIEAAPRLPIELAIAEDALEHEAREFISELVDVSLELRELIEAAE